MTEALTIERSIITSASRERVWKAITNPKNISRWIGPQIAHFETLRVGEKITFSYEDYLEYGSIAIVEPPERFAYHWKGHPRYDIQTLVTFTLQEIAEGTRITITEEGFEALPPEARREQVNLNGRGWMIALDRMAEDLSKDDDL